MGEAKRREKLGLPPRQKNKLNKSDRYLSWLPITKSRIKKYPYMGVATMAIGAIIFLVSGGANIINLQPFYSIFLGIASIISIISGLKLLQKKS